MLDRIGKGKYNLWYSIDWSDDLKMKGLNDELKKFVSNAYLRSFKSGTNKYLKVNYFSEKAYKQIKSEDYKNLIFEHIVPKQKYIQDPCILKANEKTLTIEFIQDLLKKYWCIATITKEEDSRLGAIPDNWDRIDIFVRYNSAGIVLKENDIENIEIINM